LASLNLQIHKRHDIHCPAHLAQERDAAYACQMAIADCPQCGGTGWREVPGSNGRVAERCTCTGEDRAQQLLSRARIPDRYRHCDFESFDTDLPYEASDAQQASWNRSLKQARVLLQGYAREFPIASSTGILVMGSCGVGKTHLAVAALREAALRGHAALFYDYRELLKEIQDSYNKEVQATEMSVLEPVLRADLLLLDDLGASKPSPWALETVGHILNSRYNANLATLITTNFSDGDATAAERSPAAEDTLSDRVGARIRSRLYEMCRTVEIYAPDYRREIRQAGRFPG
jgi:DNA replication protein DnaC